MLILHFNFKSDLQKARNFLACLRLSDVSEVWIVRYAGEKGMKLVLPCAIFSVLVWFFYGIMRSGTTEVLTCQMRKRQQQFYVPRKTRTENEMFENLYCPCLQHSHRCC